MLPGSKWQIDHLGLCIPPPKIPQNATEAISKLLIHIVDAIGALFICLGFIMLLDDHNKHIGK